MLPQFKLTQPESDLARALRSNSAQISNSVAKALETIPRWKKESCEYPGERSKYVALQFQAFADYAAKYFDRGDKTYFQLLVGEMLKALHDPALDSTAANEQALRVVTALREDLLLKLSQSLAPPAQIRLSGFLDLHTRQGKQNRLHELLGKDELDVHFLHHAIGLVVIQIQWLREIARARQGIDGQKLHLPVGH